MLVRAVTATAAVPEGLRQDNLLASTAGTALCLIHVVDNEWGWCYAFEQRQEGYVRLSDILGTGEFIVDESSWSSESGTDEAEQNQWMQC